MGLFQFPRGRDGLDSQLSYRWLAQNTAKGEFRTLGALFLIFSSSTHSFTLVLNDSTLLSFDITTDFFSSQ